MNKLHVKTGDLVKIISGKDKGKQSKVLEVSRAEGKVIVEGCNLSTKHIRPRQQGEHGTIVKVESPLYACKTMLVCPKCGKPTRVGHERLEGGKKMRVCKREECKNTF